MDALSDRIKENSFTGTLSREVLQQAERDEKLWRRLTLDMVFLVSERPLQS